jgi:hypothetical protein
VGLPARPATAAGNRKEPQDGDCGSRFHPEDLEGLNYRMVAD